MATQKSAIKVFLPSDIYFCPDVNLKAVRSLTRCSIKISEEVPCYPGNIHWSTQKTPVI